MMTDLPNELRDFILIEKLDGLYYDSRTHSYFIVFFECGVLHNAGRICADLKRELSEKEIERARMVLVHRYKRSDVYEKLSRKEKENDEFLPCEIRGTPWGFYVLRWSGDSPMYLHRDRNWHGRPDHRSFWSHRSNAEEALKKVLEIETKNKKEQENDD